MFWYKLSLLAKLAKKQQKNTTSHRFDANKVSEEVMCVILGFSQENKHL